MNTSTNTVLEQPEVSKAVYFPGLNALRYFAAAAVVICHVEEVKMHHGLTHYYYYFFINNGGALAVTFFFVLSGFLITYLLLKEKKVRHKVEVRNFYIRRALRIWPVYYLITILGLFILPYSESLAFPLESAKVISDHPYNSLLYIFFLPHIALWQSIFVPYASQLWSVGVEEQFYLFWPWLFKLAKRQLPIMVLIVVAFFIARVSLNFLATHWLSISQREIASRIYQLINMIRIDCMAIGGIGAYFIYNKKQWFQRYFINRTAEVLSLVGMLILFLTCWKVIRGNIYYVEYPLYSVLFLLLILNISCGKQPLFKFEGQVWTVLGNISYSVYMYQYLAIGVALILFKKLHLLEFKAGQNILFHVACQSLAIIISYISYRFFESPFLLLKNKYAPVKSTSTPS
jgi:peptidoglycan/LPS O-acetylase OafA/YrhL